MLNVATPLTTAPPKPTGVPSIVNSTEPVGTPAPDETVAVNVTFWPKTDGFCPSSTTVEDDAAVHGEGPVHPRGRGVLRVARLVGVDRAVPALSTVMSRPSTRSIRQSAWRSRVRTARPESAVAPEANGASP